VNDSKELVIKLTCSCGQTIKWTRSLAEKVVKCPHCEVRLQLPSYENLPPDQRANLDRLEDQERTRIAKAREKDDRAREKIKQKHEARQAVERKKLRDAAEERQAEIDRLAAPATKATPNPSSALEPLKAYEPLEVFKAFLVIFGYIYLFASAVCFIVSLAAFFSTMDSGSDVNPFLVATPPFLAALACVSTGFAFLGFEALIDMFWVACKDVRAIRGLQTISSGNQHQ
jgi:hypothetical protein